MILPRVFKVYFLTAMMLAVSACSVLPERPAMTVYRLPLLPAPTTNEASATSGQVGDNRPSLRVLTPSSGALLNSDRILVSQSSHQVSAYKGVRWHDQMPRIVRDQLVQALKNQGEWPVVVTDGTSTRVRYQLASELIDFQVYESTSGREIKVRVDATLIDVDKNHAVAARQFVVTEPVRGEDFDRVIQSFATATERLGKDVAMWLLTTAR